MAYDFDGTDDYIEATSAVVSNVPCTMACWFRADNVTVNHILMTVTDGTTSNRLMLEANGTLADALRCRTNAAAATGPTAFLQNTWHHAAGRWVSSTSRQAFLDGTGGTVNTLSSTVSGLNNTRLGNNSTAYLNGRLAEAAIWNTDLTDAEIASLAKGFRPSLIRPDKLVFYAPLIRDLLDVARGVTITSSGGPTVIEHPRRIA